MTIYILTSFGCYCCQLHCMMIRSTLHGVVVHAVLLFVFKDLITVISVTSPEENWRDIASDNTGQYLTAVGSYTNIWSSSDYGYSWQENAMASQLDWISVASDTTGKFIVAVGKYTHVWTSNDRGVTWIEQLGSSALYWWDVTCDSTCENIYAVVRDGGYIYTSNDYGISWQAQSSSGTMLWVSVAVDATGQFAAAVEYHGYIYKSNDHGVTWNKVFGVKYWTAVCMDSTGQYIAAVDDGQGRGGLVYASNDGGITWIALLGSYTVEYSYIESDSTGRYLAACALNGYIYTSSDYGGSWTAHDSVGRRDWYAITSDSTGQYLAAVVYDDGYIYTSIDYGQHWTVAGSQPKHEHSLNSDETGYVVGGAVGLFIVVLILWYYFRYYLVKTPTSDADLSKDTSITDTTSTTIETSMESRVIDEVSNKYRSCMDEDYYTVDFDDVEYTMNPLATSDRYRVSVDTDQILSMLEEDEYAEFSYDEDEDSDGNCDDYSNYDYRLSTAAAQTVKNLQLVPLHTVHHVK